MSSSSTIEGSDPSVAQAPSAAVRVQTKPVMPIRKPPEPSIPLGGGAEHRVRAALARADVRINGDRAWDITIINPRFYRRLFAQGLEGLGDSYVDGWWECPALDVFFDRCFRADLPRLFARSPRVVLHYLKERVLNLQTRPLASHNVRRHYDLGNDLFQRMLDSRMAYSCGYWRTAQNLAQAQEAKLDLVCRKIGLRTGMTVLDIGCGWGSFVKFAAERYGARAVGITLSPEQARFAEESCRGLPVEIRLQDYREVRRRFDRIVSIGMFEHVGAKNHRCYMEIAAANLADDGLFLLHCFGSKHPFPTTFNSEVDWVERNIFPGMLVPSMGQIATALDGLFVVEDVQNFGTDYDPTLMAWHANFERAWPDLRARYDDRFHRMWRYYLLCCAAAFRSRRYQLWQIVLSKEGTPTRYIGAR